MKKLTFILTVLSLLSQHADAQKGYLRIGTGYGMPNAGQTRGVDGYPINGTAQYYNTSFTTMSVKKASFAAGANLNLAIGYMFNDKFGIEMNSLLIYQPVKYTSSFKVSDATYSSSGTSTLSAKNPIILLPSVVLKTGNKVKFFIRAGLAIPINTKMKYNVQESVGQKGVTYNIVGNSVISNNLNLGLAASMGMELTLIKGVHFYFQSDLLSMSLYTKQEDVVSYSVNGQNLKNYVTPTTYYKKEYSGSGQGTYSQPFSSIGGSIGFQIDFK